MGFLKKLVKSIGNVVEDVAKSALVPINQSYKSITGDNLIKNVTKSSTGFGKVLIGLNKVSVDTTHTIAQGYANSVTGGYASKLHEKLVPGIVESQKAEQNAQYFTKGPLSRFEGITKKAAPIIGQAAAAALGGEKDTSKATSALKTTSSKNVGLLSGLVKGANKVGDALVKFSNTGVGQAATGVLGSYVANLANANNKNTGIYNPVTEQIASYLATSTGLPAVAQAGQTTAAQAALFSGQGLSVNVPVPGETFWDKNKAWLMPLSIGISVLGFLIVVMKMLTGKRR